MKGGFTKPQTIIDLDEYNYLKETLASLKEKDYDSEAEMFRGLILTTINTAGFFSSKDMIEMYIKAAIHMNINIFITGDLDNGYHITVKKK